MKVAQGLSLSVIDQAPTEDVEAGIYGPLGVALEFYLETAPTTTPQPATYWWLNDVEVTIAVPDRSLVLTPTTYAGEILGDEQAVLTALGGAKTTGSLKHHEAIYEEVDPRPSVAVFIDPDTYLSNSEREVRLTGVALLGETHLRMLGTMPLEKGASLRRGPTTLQILSIQSTGSRPWALDGSGDALVRVASRWIDPTPRTRACSYVFVIYDPQQNTALGAFWNIGSRALPALLSPPSLRVRASTLKLEHSWLTRGAELVVLEDCLGPLVRAPFSLDRFRMVDYTKAAHRKRMELEGAQTTANTSEAENGS